MERVWPPLSAGNLPCGVHRDSRKQDACPDGPPGCGNVCLPAPIGSQSEPSLRDGNRADRRGQRSPTTRGNPPNWSEQQNRRSRGNRLQRVERSVSANGRPYGPDASAICRAENRRTSPITITTAFAYTIPPPSALPRAAAARWTMLLPRTAPRTREKVHIPMLLEFGKRNQPSVKAANDDGLASRRIFVTDRNS